MTEIEKKAALALFPYFSKSPVVVDVGSNKGDWAEVLAANVDMIVLFEPNTLLRHYSMVRFRYLKNVKYLDSAVSNQISRADFYYFEDEHDGLSNIIGNKTWDYLFPKHEVIDTVTIDSCDWAYIDMIKIDVEGAELSVLQGCEKMLRNKRIKFIQVEYAEHIVITGKTFNDIIDFMESFGYRLFIFFCKFFCPSQ